MEGIVASLITGGLALLGVIITCVSSNRKIEKKLEVAQAVTDTKIDELTREVREHNNFAKRMPVVENAPMLSGNDLSIQLRTVIFGTKINLYSKTDLSKYTALCLLKYTKV